MKFNMIPDLKSKVILTDCDGVLLDWKYSFYQFMARQNQTVVNHNTYSMAETFDISEEKANDYVRIFNNSAEIAHLTPFRDAVKSIRYLYEAHGMVLHVITALSTNPVAHDYRMENLNNVFGKGVVERLICTDPEHPDKTQFLEEYKGTNCIWVEDSPKNAIAGARLGLNTFSINHSHNQHFVYDDEDKIECVHEWEDIIQWQNL